MSGWNFVISIFLAIGAGLLAAALVKIIGGNDFQCGGAAGIGLCQAVGWLDRL